MTYDSLQLHTDNGICKAYTAKCSAGVTGGDLLKWTSGTNCVGSRLTTFDWNDIAVEKTDSSENFVGLAMYKQDSGAAVAVITDGIVLLPVGSTVVSGGQLVGAAGYGNMVVPVLPTDSGTKIAIGRALTTGGALTQFVAVNLRV